MTHVLAATTGLFRDRDLFIHDGARLRRFRVSAPVQAASIPHYSRPRRVGQLCNGSPDHPPSRRLPAMTLSAATEARARMIEQRQALIEAALCGPKDRCWRTSPLPSAAAALRPTGRWPASSSSNSSRQRSSPRALDVRYQVTAAELKRLGINTPRAGVTDGVGARSRAPATRASKRCSIAGRSSTSCRTASSRSRRTSRSRPT